MNKSYLIAPLVLLAIFAVTYNNSLKEMNAREMVNQEKAVKIKLEEKKRKDEVELKATADAKRRQEERDAEDLKKQAKKQAEYDEVMKSLRDQTADYTTQAAKLTKEITDLEAQIAQNRNAKENLIRENLELSKTVELTKINRRNAELEIQRTIEMVAKKLNDSSIAVPPPPPPPVAAK
jgi:septal ring factor EnvC (AmiA/AmiB activator)